MVVDPKAQHRINTSLTEYTKHLSDLLKGVTGNSKVNEVKIDNNCSTSTKIIIFQIAKECYFTLSDAARFVKYHIDRGGFSLEYDIEDLLAEMFTGKRMVELDPMFNNEDIIVMKCMALDEKAYETILKASKPSAVKDSSISCDVECENFMMAEDGYYNAMSNIPQNGNCMNNRESENFLPNEDLNFYSENINIPKKTSHMKDRESEMFSSIGVTDITNRNNPKIINKHGYESMDRISSFQPFANDWTSEMVDSIMGDMFENPRAEQISAPQNYVQNPPEHEHEFLAMRDRYMGEKVPANASRPFICHFRMCNRAFKRFEHLKRHYRIHTGERPFKCKYPGCNKAFARSDNLNQHLKVHGTGSPPQSQGSRHAKYMDNEY